MPKPRILPNVILGLLDNHQPLSGHDIKAAFQTEIGEFWQASHSQIYPELKRMLADQWIKVAADVSQTDAKVISYAITESGRNQLIDWLHEPVTGENDQLSSLKLYFIHDRTSPTLMAILQAELALHQDKLVHLQQRQALLFADQADIDADYGHYLILIRAIERETNNLAWLKRTLKDAHTR